MCIPLVVTMLFAVTAFKNAGGDIRVEKRGLYGHHPHGFEHGDIPRIIEYFKPDNKEQNK